MPKGHTEEQIVAALTAQEGGETTREICRRMGISTATFYSWKKQYAGVGVGELLELRQLREENNKFRSPIGDDDWRSQSPYVHFRREMRTRRRPLSADGSSAFCGNSRKNSFASPSSLNRAKRRSWGS